MRCSFLLVSTRQHRRLVVAIVLLCAAVVVVVISSETVAATSAPSSSTSYNKRMTTTDKNNDNLSTTCRSSSSSSSSSLYPYATRWNVKSTSSSSFSTTTTYTFLATATAATTSACCSVRGGGGGTNANANPNDARSTTTVTAPTVTNTTRTTTTTLSTTLKTIGQNVLPHWTSLCHFLQQKTKLVQERVHELQVQQQQHHPITTTTTATTTTDNTEDSSTVVNPLHNLVETTRQIARERQHVIIQQQDSKRAASLLLRPSRFVQLTIGTWAVTEVLYQFGLFDNPAGLAPTIRQVWTDHAQPPLDDVRDRLSSWWYTERLCSGGLLRWSTYGTVRGISSLLQRLHSWTPRHQFALGTCIGMIVSPIVWSCLLRGMKVTFILYVVSEMNEVCRQRSLVGDSLIEILGFRGRGGDVLNDLLDDVRERIRSTVQYPDKTWTDICDCLQEDSVDGPPANTKQGFVLGTIVGVIV